MSFAPSNMTTELKSLYRFILVIAGTLTLGAAAGQSGLNRIVVLQAAELIIGGKTNVNSFSCSLRKSNLCDTLAVFGRTLNDYTVFDGLEIGFDVADFGCDLALMTRDFRALLKSDTYPQIRMRIDEIKYEGNSRNGSGGPVSAMITLLIAGERGVEHIRKANIHRIQQKVIFSGTHEVLMTRFKIDPPTKMFGAVRTEDQLEIDFAIQIQ
jgi:hypothetical protein